jgi:hypothetical protein
MSKFYEFYLSEEGTVSLAIYPNEREMLKVINRRVADGEEAKYLCATEETNWRDIGNYGPRGYLLFKGEVVVPKPKKVVTEYEL